MDHEKLGERLKSARQRMLPPLTQKDVAVLMGKSPSAVNLWEKGKTSPDVFDLVSVARVLNVSCDWLLGVSDNSNPAGGETGPFSVPILSGVQQIASHLSGDLKFRQLQTSRSYPNGVAFEILESDMSICPAGSFAVVDLRADCPSGSVVAIRSEEGGTPLLRHLIRGAGVDLLKTDDVKTPDPVASVKPLLVGLVREIITRRAIA